MKLQRTLSAEAFTFGEFLTDDGDVICKTLELAWKDNAPQVSCIPAGEYIAKRRFSPKHGYDLFGIDGVPDRSDIEIHIGNYPKDSLGCVLVGATTALNPPMVTHSTETFRAFMQHFAGVDSFPLTVLDVPIDVPADPAPQPAQPENPT